MVTLKINNSYSQLFGLSPDQYRDLRGLLSYTIDSGPGTRPRRVSLLSKRLEFPSGLVYIVEKYFSGTVHAIEDFRMPPKMLAGAPPSLFTGGSSTITPYPEQEEAVEALMSIGKGRGIISASTGTGKSLIVALLINRLLVRTLVVVPSLELKYQLTRSLTEWFGEINFHRFVVVANIGSLSPQKRLGDFGAVIVDEFHHGAAKTYRECNKHDWKNIYHRIGLSATPYRADDSERLLLESFLAQVVYEIPYQTAVDKGYIVPLAAFVIGSPKFQLKGNQRNYHAMYHECIVANAPRNTRIALTMGRLAHHGKATLCLVKEIRHGEILSALTGFPFANGQDGRSRELIRQFNAGEIKQLIGSSVIQEGVDTKPAEYILLAGSGKSPVQFAQNIGRGFRKYPGKLSCKVILFTSPSHAWFRSHHKHQLAILRDRYGCEAEVIDI